MLRKLSDFNSRLADISTQMAIGLVQIDGSTFEIKVGERLYRDMSDSAQFRARIAMQVATAEIDGSCMVIIDNDVDFDTRWYQKLLGMLLTRGMRAVVSLRVDAIGKAMNTAKATNPVVREKIASYWLQDGTATKLEKGEE
jgi:pyrimidine operon attenuation protein/uracil phosphoribosyltransferase